MNKRRKLPIGIQSFADIRRNGYVYVDKTRYVWELAHFGKPYFLSRPRRFGKSLFLSTLEAYFLGKRELFDGLVVQELEDAEPEPWQEYPVFRFDFSPSRYVNIEDIENRISYMLSVYEKVYAETGNNLDICSRFSALIEAAYKKTGK